MKTESYEIHVPKQMISPFVFSSPHSGRNYNKSFLENSILDDLQIRSSEDAFVNDLYASAPDQGCPLITARAPRAFIDLNRSPDELDGSIIEGVKSNHSNPRVMSGLGIIPRVVAEGRAIQSGKMPFQEAQDRIENFYRPYHDQLKSLLADTVHRFGQAVLIDCHSMPHASTHNMVVKGGGRPDIVIGDRFGASSDNILTDQIEACFVAEGFSTSRNVPFAGAFILQQYGKPSLGQHAVQIEIDRRLYMEEKTVRKSEDFWDTRDRLGRVVARICAIDLIGMRLAAE